MTGWLDKIVRKIDVDKFLASIFMFMGIVFLFVILATYLVMPDETGKNIMLIFLLVPIVFIVVSIIEFRVYNKKKRARDAETGVKREEPHIARSEEELTARAPVNWNDGKIHTISSQYDINDPDEWHENLRRHHGDVDEPQYIKGRQMGRSYVTNDPKVTIPAYIISCVVMLVITIVLLCVLPVAGIIAAIFTVIWIVETLRNIPKWRKLLQERNKEQ